MIYHICIGRKDRQHGTLVFEAVYGGLRNVIDAFMVPFLLPLLECAPEGSLTRSAPQLDSGWKVCVNRMVYVC